MVNKLSTDASCVNEDRKDDALRQIYYGLVSDQVIDNNEITYKKFSKALKGNLNPRGLPCDKRVAAHYIGVVPGTLDVWASTKAVIIPYHKIGKKRVYFTFDLDAYLDSVRVEVA